MLLINTSAPGSLMLLGEHAVLHGSACIVMSTEKRLHVTLTPRADNQLNIFSSLADCHTTIDHIVPSKPLTFVLTTLTQFPLPSGCDIHIRTELSHTQGFGSSAAVTVALVKALHTWLKRSLEPHALFNVAKTIMLKVQGRGSGADIAASSFEGCIYYHPNKNHIEKISASLNISTAYCGFKTPTTKVIALVDEMATESPETYQNLYKGISTVVEAGKTALSKQDFSAFAIAMKKNQALMEALGVNHPSLQACIDLFEADTQVLAAKISGSGLGDCVYALTTRPPQHYFFAPTNIALVKYWGKRDTKLNLPLTSSLSLTIPSKGTMTAISEAKNGDTYSLNGTPEDEAFNQRLKAFLDPFRPHKDFYFCVDTHVNIPIAAGLASSASGFAALTLALNAFFHWDKSTQALSIIARQGSGSACRSFWPDFVEWQAGTKADGLDSFAFPLDLHWPGLHLGVLMIDKSKKPISSRQAMQKTVTNSALYQKQWASQVSQDLTAIKTAIKERNFTRFGHILENNALLMHATMEEADVHYTTNKTRDYYQKIWALRKEGLAIFFTQDAGPNLKVLFLEHDREALLQIFPELEVVR